MYFQIAAENFDYLSKNNLFTTPPPPSPCSSDKAPGGTVLTVHRVNIQLGAGAEDSSGTGRRQWYSEFEWEQEHSALELLASCPWIVPQFGWFSLYLENRKKTHRDKDGPH